MMTQDSPGTQATDDNVWLEMIITSSDQLKGPILADQFASLMVEQGLTLADLLEGLPEIREEIYQERYDGKTRNNDSSN